VIKLEMILILIETNARKTSLFVDLDQVVNVLHSNTFKT